MAETDEERRNRERSARQLAKVQVANERKILAEYSRLGTDPVRAGEFLLTPSLVAILRERS